MHSYLFPKAYSFWLAERFPKAVHETLATCRNCAMIKPEGLTRDPGPFQVGLKCCTYFPFLPNFSLGQLPTGKIQDVALSGILLPVGLYPSKDYQTAVQKFGASGFGQRQELLCPFFSSKEDACTIWDQRPGVCTTYFCKSNRGHAGLLLWKDIEKYLNQFEWALACETLKRMGVHENTLAFSQSAIRPNTEDEERPFFIQAAWNSAAGFYSVQNLAEQISFYQKASEVSQKIQATELDQILGKETLSLEKKILNLL